MGDSCPKFILDLGDTSNACAATVTVAESDFFTFHQISSGYGRGVTVLDITVRPYRLRTYAFQLRAHG